MDDLCLELLAGGAALDGMECSAGLRRAWRVLLSRKGEDTSRAADALYQADVPAPLAQRLLDAWQCCEGGAQVRVTHHTQPGTTGALLGDTQHAHALLDAFIRLHRELAARPRAWTGRDLVSVVADHNPPSQHNAGLLELFGAFVEAGFAHALARSTAAHAGLDASIIADVLWCHPETANRLHKLWVRSCQRAGVRKRDDLPTICRSQQLRISPALPTTPEHVLLLEGGRYALVVCGRELVAMSCEQSATLERIWTRRLPGPVAHLFPVRGRPAAIVSYVTGAARYVDLRTDEQRWLQGSNGRLLSVKCPQGPALALFTTRDGRELHVGELGASARRHRQLPAQIIHAELLNTGHVVAMSSAGELWSSAHDAPVGAPLRGETPRALLTSPNAREVVSLYGKQAFFRREDDPPEQRWGERSSPSGTILGALATNEALLLVDAHRRSWWWPWDEVWPQPLRAPVLPEDALVVLHCEGTTPTLHAISPDRLDRWMLDNVRDDRG